MSLPYMSAVIVASRRSVLIFHILRIIRGRVKVTLCKRENILITLVSIDEVQALGIHNPKSYKLLGKRN